jgi:hypothetical protein
LRSTAHPHRADLRAPSRALMLMELRALPELGGFLAALPLLAATTPRGDGHPVLVLPGLITTDRSTVPLRNFLRGRNYAVEGWEAGRNYGLLPGIAEHMLTKVKAMADKHGRKVSLIGWSLGGVYARQLAKILPDEVRGVITLGSPFNGHPRATNAWRLYEFTSGHKVDDRDTHMGGAVHEPPPVPSTAIYSRTDGICAWQCCVETAGENRENIEVEASHCGLGHHPAAVYAIADRLAQKDGEWRPFDRSGAKRFFFPPPHHAH